MLIKLLEGFFYRCVVQKREQQNGAAPQGARAWLSELRATESLRFLLT